MGRVSVPTISLFILGVILIIIAGFTGPDVPTISVLLRNLPYFFFIGGCVLIIAAVALMLRKR